MSSFLFFFLLLYMLTQNQIDNAIKFLKTQKGQLPTALLRLNLKAKGDKLLVDNREVVPQERLSEIIKSYDQDPKTTGGVLRLWQHIRRDYWGVSRQAVEDYVSKSSSHQIHQPLPKKTTSRSIVTKAPGYQWQVDLIDMSDLEQPDKYALTAIDLFDKKAYAVPLRNKEGKTVAAGLDSILKANTPPKLVQSDRGAEFESEFDKVLAKHNVKHVRSLPYNPTSQGSVERLNGSLKKDIYRMMTLKKTNNWAPLLEAAVANHNNSITRSTGMAPNDVKQSDVRDVKTVLDANAKKPPSDRVFAVGDKVRVALTALDRKSAQFRKGSKQNWSDEIYTVRAVSKPSATSQQQYLLEGSNTRYWSYQLLKIPDVVIQDHVPGERPKRARKEKLDRLDVVDEDYVPEKKDDLVPAPVVAPSRGPVPAQEGRPKRNRARRIVSNDYVWLD